MKKQAVPVDDHRAAEEIKVITSAQEVGCITGTKGYLAVGFFGLCWLMLACAGTAASAAQNMAPALHSDTVVSHEGYFVLSWDGVRATSALLLQQADSVDFSNPREYPLNPAGSLTLSGFADGDYYFRIGQPGAWGTPLQISVAHHSMARAMGFFSIGLLLFATLILVIVRGNRSPGN